MKRIKRDASRNAAHHQRPLNKIQRKQTFSEFRNTLQITDESGNKITSYKTEDNIFKTLRTKFGFATAFKKLSCNYCGNIYIIEDDLKTHLESHAHKGKRANQIGGKVKDKAVLIPSEEMKFACSICPLKFRVKSTLLIHERRHRNASAYACKYCKELFGNSIKLQLHLRLHTGEQPYKCSRCSVKFSYISTLSDHMAKEHNTTCSPALNAFISFENKPIKQEPTLTDETQFFPAKVVANDIKNIDAGDKNTGPLESSEEILGI